jgi:hypothetical protein
MAMLFSCAYEDFKQDFPFSTVYFNNQKLKRNFVEDDINTIKIGVVLGGKWQNLNEEWISYSISYNGLASTPYDTLPENYYTLSNTEKFVIPAGEFIGEISMTINPSFFADTLAAGDHYALIFRILDTSADSILYQKDSLMLIVGFESRVFGNYYHNGQVILKDHITEVPVDTISYHQEVPVTNLVNNWSLVTKATKTVYSNGMAHYAPGPTKGFFIRVNNDNSLVLFENPDLITQGYNWQFEQNTGQNLYDPESRKFYLNYKFTDITSGYDCYATDTLIFRNRILDGVNQWDF